jgi:hypothetical protein
LSVDAFQPSVKPPLVCPDTANPDGTDGACASPDVDELALGDAAAGPPDDPDSPCEPPPDDPDGDCVPLPADDADELAPVAGALGVTDGAPPAGGGTRAAFATVTVTEVLMMGHRRARFDISCCVTDPPLQPATPVTFTAAP